MMKIVIVEDHPVLRNIYQKKFTLAGYSVAAASGGLAGIDLIGRRKPDLVLLDVGLPDISGIEVLKRLRSNPEFQNLPICVFSDSELAGGALAEGATLVASKSSRSPEQLLRLVQNLIPFNDSVRDQDSEEEMTSSENIFHPESINIDGSAVKNVLFVEDHADTAALILYSLKQSGCNVTVVSSHDAASIEAECGDFDLFLLNRFCADGHSTSLCTELRRLHPDAAIVVYSTVSLPEEQQSALRSGADAYLTQAAKILDPIDSLTSLRAGTFNLDHNNGDASDQHLSLM